LAIEWQHFIIENRLIAAFLFLHIQLLPQHGD